MNINKDLVAASAAPMVLAILAGGGTAMATPSSNV